jgi:NHL repeat
VFDSNGQFIRQFALPPRTTPQPTSTSNDMALIRPYGLCVSSSGQLYVCDRDGHRVLWYTNDGQFGGDLLQSVDASQAVKYPCGVAVTQTVDSAGTTCTLVAVAESCNGLLDNDRHHAVKLYMV